jgi:hypothetical protein
MISLSLIRAFASAALVAAALGACGRGPSDPGTQAPPATTGPASTDATAEGAATGDAARSSGTPTANTPPLSVTAVDVGSAVGADQRVTTAASMFDRDATIYVSVATDGSIANVPVTARWTFQDGQVIASETRTVEHAGPAVTAFRVSRPEGWPSGQYRVQVSVGDRVVQARDFAVR